MKAITRLDGLLKAAGVPIFGVYQNEDGTFGVHYDNATVQQVLIADTILQNFDGLGTRPRSLQDIADAVEALTTAQQRKVFCYAVAYLAISDPRVADRLRAAFGIEPEEPDGP